MNENSPLYNSRIMKIYLQYLSKYYPDVDVDSALEYAGMTKYEVEDPAHWFNQGQADRFYEVLVQTTGNASIAREAGRYAVSSEALNILTRYLLGLINLTSVYFLMGKIYPTMSRGATIRAKKVGSNKVEITSTPKSGVHEKLYQCENRLGSFESVGTLFSKTYAKVEHPSCFHKGDDCCRYLISWEENASYKWRRIRNFCFLVNIAASVSLYFVIPILPWIVSILVFTYITVIFSLYSSGLEKKELTRTIESQGDTAQNLLDEINIRYNNALLVQEIGQATSTIFDIKKLINNVVQVMKKHLDFDRGMIMLSNREKTRLIYAAGYGYNSEQEELLKGTYFHLDNPESQGGAAVARR